MKNIMSFIKFIIFCYIYKLTDRTFVADGKKFSYFYHPHGSWANERCVEVAIGKQCIKYYKPEDVLEIGNVISMYQPVFHTVVDKYDKQMGVINEDVVDFNTKKKYGLILSLSTLEHVGFDETVGIKLNDADKIPHAIENLKKCLAENGKLIVTMPLGYNPNLDKRIKDDTLGFTNEYFLKRVSTSNRWKQIKKEDITDIKFGYPYLKANGLFIGVYTKLGVKEK